VAAPACRTCAWWLHLRNLRGIVISFAIVFGVYRFVWPHMAPHVGLSLRAPAVFAVSLLCMIPFMLWDAFFPPAFKITANQEIVNYKFRDIDYALEFAACNCAAKRVLLNGEDIVEVLRRSLRQRARPEAGSDESEASTRRGWGDHDQHSRTL
jgi:hypothetical protein